MDNNEVSYNNVEEIINALKSVTQCVRSYRKVDGITIECESLNENIKTSAKNEVQAMSKKFGIVPNSIQDSKLDKLMFAIQYPELIPVYSDELVRKMYRDNFKFLINNIKMKDPKSVSKALLYENMDGLTKHSITIFCKSNINMYKDNLNNYLTDKKYRQKINTLFIEFVEDYFNGDVE